MATATHTVTHPTDRIPLHVSILNAVGSAARTFGTAVMLSQQSRARALRREALMVMSDAQLAELGINRDQINAYIYPELLDR